MPHTDQSLITFLVLITLLTITPGTDTALVLKSAMKGGRRFYVATSLGICTGLLFHASMSSLGLSAILQQSAQAYSVIKMLGAAYLIYLGVRGLYETWLRKDESEIAKSNSNNQAVLAEKVPQSGTSLSEHNVSERSVRIESHAGDKIQSHPQQVRAVNSAPDSNPDSNPVWNPVSNPLRTEFRTGLITNMLNPKVAVFYLTFLPQFVNTQKNVFVQTVALALVHIVLSLIWLFTIGEFVNYFRAQLAKPATKKTIETVTSFALLGFGLRLAISQT